MIRTSSDAIKAYCQASEIDKAKMLIGLSFDLTITARDLTSSIEAGKKELLPGLSEIQHVALGQAVNLLSGGAHRYPDADVIPVIVKTAERFGLARKVQESISKHLSKISDVCGTDAKTTDC